MAGHVDWSSRNQKGQIAEVWTIVVIVHVHVLLEDSLIGLQAWCPTLDGGRYRRDMQQARQVQYSETRSAGLRSFDIRDLV